MPTIQSGEIVAIVIVVLLLLASGIFICFRCCKSMFEAAEASRKERLTFSRALRRSIRRSFRRTASRAGEFARRASFRGRAGSINRQRRRRPQMPTHTGGSDLHPYWLQKKEDRQDAPPSYNEAMTENPPQNQDTPTQTQAPAVLSVTQLPNTQIGPRTPTQQSVPPTPDGRNTYNQRTPTYPSETHPRSPSHQGYTPKQSPYGEPAPGLNNSGYSRQPGQGQARTPSQSNLEENNRQNYTNTRNSSSSTPYDKWTQGANQYRNETRKPSAEDEEAGFGNSEPSGNRGRMISSSSQGHGQMPQPHGQYKDPYSQQRTYGESSPRYANQDQYGPKSPVARDLSQYYNEQSTNSPSGRNQQRPYGNTTVEHTSYSRGNYSDRGDQNMHEGQYSNVAYEHDSPSHAPPPPPARGYSIERTQAYKDYPAQTRSPQGVPYSPTSHSPGYSPKHQPDYSPSYPAGSRGPGQTPGGAVYYNPKQRVLELSDQEQMYSQPDTYI